MEQWRNWRRSQRNGVRPPALVEPRWRIGGRDETGCICGGGSDHRALTPGGRGRDKMYMEAVVMSLMSVILSHGIVGDWLRARRRAAPPCPFAVKCPWVDNLLMTHLQLRLQSLLVLEWSWNGPGQGFSFRTSSPVAVLHFP